MDLYREEILDQLRNSPFKRRLINPTVVAREVNPLCGDDLTLMLKVKNDKIEEVAFWGEGCAISQVSASFLCNVVLGKTLIQARKIKEADQLQNLGLTLSPSRTKCALLSVWTLQKVFVSA